MAVACPIEEAVRAHVSHTASISAQSDEQRLIAAAKAGDQHAYGRLLERHQAAAFRAACLITGSAAEAEDATQDACVKAWLALRRFRPGAPFRPWLVRIAINEARNRRRSAGRSTNVALRPALPRSVRGRATSRGRPARDRGQVLPRALRGRDRDRFGAASRDRQVAAIPRAGSAPDRIGDS